MRSLVPVTATSMSEWVRRVANAVNGLILDTEALSMFARVPFTVASITFVPKPLPGTPEIGETVMDEADLVVKTWNGTAWRPHY